jgi:predicted amidohydrolase YtcJ
LAQNIHAIGDRANEVVLDAFEDVLKKPGVDVDTWRPRIEHAQIIQPSDLERIGRLGGG